MAEPLRVELKLLQAGQRKLLDNVALDFDCAGLYVIVGPSGAGKSTLLRALAGAAVDLDDVTVNGRMRAGAEKPVLVPQEGGLLRELTTTEMVRFAMDQQGHEGDPVAILRRLGVPADRPVVQLSVGEAKRCAVAWALATRRPIVLYDEPTAGLDPAAARKVAHAIWQQHQELQGITVVVTHDYRSFADVADQILVLDPTDRTVRPVSPGDMAAIHEVLERAVPSVPAPLPRPSVLKRLLNGPVRAIAALGGVVEALALSCVSLVVLLFRLIWRYRATRWCLRTTRHYLKVLGGPTAVAHVLLGGLIGGFVATHFTFEHLPYRRVLEPLLTEDILAGIGVTLHRVVVPVLVTVLIAARSGAAAAADVGLKQFTGQLQTLRSLDAPPAVYVLSPLILAFCLTTPLLGFVGYLAAMLSSAATFVARYPDHGLVFWRYWVHAEVWPPGAALPVGTGWVLLKYVAGAYLVAVIAYWQGSGRVRNETDLAHAVTRAVLMATLAVLFVHVAVALVEF